MLVAAKSIRRCTRLAHRTGDGWQLSGECDGACVGGGECGARGLVAPLGGAGVPVPRPLGDADGGGEIGAKPAIASRLNPTGPGKHLLLPTWQPAGTGTAEGKRTGKKRGFQKFTPKGVSMKPVPKGRGRRGRPCPPAPPQSAAIIVFALSMTCCETVSALRIASCVCSPVIGVISNWAFSASAFSSGELIAFQKPSRR